MFERIIHITMQAVLVVAVAAVGYWGYQEHQDKNSVLIKAENSYQRAFHELNNNVSNLEDELGKSLAMNSRKLIAPCMANIWRITYVAQGNVGQLPLNLMAFSKTEEFLADISDFTYEIGMRDLDQEPISDKEWNRLKTLHQQAKEIQSELSKVQSEILNENLRWMDVEVALASENVDMDKTIIQGFEGLEEQVQGYIETEGGATENKQAENLQEQGKIKGKDINKTEAKKKARDFLELKQDAELKVEELNVKDGLSTYSMHVKQANEDTISIDISKKGGHVLWFLNSRDIEKSTIGLNEAQNTANDFLEKHGMKNMTAVESNQYDHVGVFEFVREINQVRVYPDLVTVKVALDTGDIIGFQAQDYVVNNHGENPEIQKPTISLSEAKEKVNSNLKVLEDHLAIVEMKEGEEKLCYELLGTIENETYRIFINAETGEEEKIEKMKKAQSIV